MTDIQIPGQRVITPDGQPGLVIQMHEARATLLVHRGRRWRYATADLRTLIIAPEHRDTVTATLTAFTTFDELLTANGGYRPSLYGKGWFTVLANTYDQQQAERNDPRRAAR